MPGSAIRFGNGIILECLAVMAGMTQWLVIPVGPEQHISLTLDWDDVIHNDGGCVLPCLLAGFTERVDFEIPQAISLPAVGIATLRARTATGVVLRSRLAEMFSAPP